MNIISAIAPQLFPSLTHTWRRAMTSEFSVKDPAAFSAFLTEKGVDHLQKDDCFQLFASDMAYWPGMRENLFLSLEEPDEEEEVDEARSPEIRKSFQFWRDVQAHMLPDISLDVTEIGYIAAAPLLFGRAVNHFACWMHVEQSGLIHVIDFENTV
jgi:hypothetical protein